MTVHHRPDWRHSAACRDHDPELFFPVAGSGSELYVRQVAEAKAVCAGCPVRARCLEFALEQLPYGVAGGLDEHERAALRRGQRRTRPRPVTVCPARQGPVSRADLGRVALRAGRSVVDVAVEFGVTERTAQRWRHR
jgi:hypothetical protein